MNLRKILISSLVVALAVSFSSCKKDEPCEHVDKDDDFVCDKCGEDFDDGIEKESCSFTVVDSDGNKLSGAKFTLARGSVKETFTSGANGTVSAELLAGKYSVEFDYDTIPSGFLPSVFAIEVKEDATSFELLIMNNNPNGTEERPFVLSENETSGSIPANGEVFYALHGGNGKKLVIENENVTVVYNGETYRPENGIVEVPFSSDIGEMNRFSVKNGTASDIELVVQLVSPLGSFDNPIVISENSVTANVPAGGGICYKWIAPSDGVLLITSDNTKNNINLTNSTTNVVSSQTDGSAGEYMAVSAGDEVIISVSAKTSKNDSAKFTEIQFNVALYAGTSANPIPVIKDIIDVSLGANTSFTFAWDGIGDVELKDDDATLVKGDGYFTVTNSLDTINGVVIEIFK